MRPTGTKPKSVPRGAPQAVRIPHPRNTPVPALLSRQQPMKSVSSVNTNTAISEAVMHPGPA